MLLVEPFLKDTVNWLDHSFDSDQTAPSPVTHDAELQPIFVNTDKTGLRLYFLVDSKVHTASGLNNKHSFLYLIEILYGLDP